jgi:hypothetical protein
MTNGVHDTLHLPMVSFFFVSFFNSLNLVFYLQNQLTATATADDNEGAEGEKGERRKMGLETRTCLEPQVVRFLYIYCVLY